MSKHNGKHLHIELTVAEYELYQIYTKSQGRRLNDWAREALRNAVPANVLRQLEAPAADTSGRDAAFAVLDQADAEEGIIPLAPEVRVATNEPPAHTIVHPCRHLSRVYAPPFTARDSQGTCVLQQRVCFWAAEGARQCLQYKPKTMPVPSPHTGR